MKKLSTFVLALMSLLVMSNYVSAQEIGDYVATTAGDYNTATNWSISDGAGGYSGVATAAPVSATNVWIPSGIAMTSSAASLAKEIHVLGSYTLGGTLSCQSIYVPMGGVVLSSATTSTSQMTLQIGYYADGDANVAVDGTLGNIDVNGTGKIRLSMQVKKNCNFNFTGTGTIAFFGVVYYNGAADKTVNVNIKTNVTITNGGFSLQSWSSTLPRTLTIDEGATLTLNSGSTSGQFFNQILNPPTADQGDYIYNINGKLDASACSSGAIFATTSITTASSKGSMQKNITNIGAKGELVLPANVFWNKQQASQTLEMNVLSGGKVTFAGAAYKTISTTATDVVLPLTSFKNISFTNAGSVTLTGGLVVNESLTVAGTGLSVIGALVNLGSVTGIVSTAEVVNASSADVTKGMVSATVTGYDVTLTASPVSGYVFSNWTENGVEVANTATYTFTSTASRTLVANFVVDPGTGLNNNANNAFVVIEGRNLKFSADVLSAEVYNGVGQLIVAQNSNNVMSLNKGMFIVKMNTLHGVNVQKVIVK